MRGSFKRFYAEWRDREKGMNPRDRCSKCDGMRDPPSYYSSFGCEASWIKKCQCNPGEFPVEKSYAFTELKTRVDDLASAIDRNRERIVDMEHRSSKESHLDRIAEALRHVYDRFSEIEADIRAIKAVLEENRKIP